MSTRDALTSGPDRTLLSFLEDPVMVLDRGGLVVYVNPAFRSRFEVSRETVVKRPVSEAMPEWMSDSILGHLRALEPDGPANNFLLKNDKERFRVSMAGITLQDRVAGAVVTLWDSAREVEFKFRNMELFRAMLDDLEVPINDLKVMLSKSSQNRGFAEPDRFQVEHLEEGLSRFRDFAELLFGEIRTERVPFFPHRLLGLVRKSLRSLVEKRDVYLEEGLSRELPRVLGDPALLNRVLALLVEYMVRAVPAGEIVVMAADLLLMKSGAAWLSYSITGTGFVSLETEILEGKAPILDTFRVLPDERKRLVLRLFLSRRLVTAMGGKVSVAADKMAGTTISVRVPVELQMSGGGGDPVRSVKKEG